MIAHHHPFVGQFCAADAAFDDIVGLRAVVHFDFEMDFYAFAAEVILDRQSALPVLFARGERGRPCFRAAVWRRARRAAEP